MKYFLFFAFEIAKLTNVIVLLSHRGSRTISQRRNHC